MLALVIIGFVIWIVCLISLIRRTDCSDTDKIIWTIILCTLNIVGVLLYFCLGPAGKNDRVLTEQELKDKFNRGEG